MALKGSVLLMAAMMGTQVAVTVEAAMVGQTVPLSMADHS